MADGSAATSAVQKAAANGPDPLIGRVINDRFKVVALIARGGMGKVYRAEQAPLGRVCALKVLTTNYAGDSDPEFHKRFFLEASIASKLTHPNTVTIFDYGRTDDDIYYIAMEYLEGRTLHRAIREEGPFPEERATHICRQICRALREAHSLGVIHRDLKPANIYLVEHADETDFVKVLDFGLVKNVSEGQTEELTQAGLFMGSPKYMSPEQIRGDKVDARTDIYSLGIVMYEMLTGKVPFDRANSVNILMAHVNEPPPPLREMFPECVAGPGTEEVLFKCIAKAPADRYTSMDDLLTALKKAGSGAMTGTMMGMPTGEFSAVSTSGVFGSQSGSGPLNVTGSGSGSQSGPVLGLPASEEKKSNKGLVIGLGAIGLVAVVGIGIAATSGGSTDANKGNIPSASAAKTTAAATTAATATTSATTVASATAPKKVVVRMDSDPTGAAVKLRDRDGKELCKETPCDIDFTGDDAKDGTEHKLVLVKKGYNPETKVVKIGTDSKVSIKLTVERAVGGAAPPPPAGKGGDQGGGFKVVPY